QGRQRDPARCCLAGKLWRSINTSGPRTKERCISSRRGIQACGIAESKGSSPKLLKLASGCGGPILCRLVFVHGPAHFGEGRQTGISRRGWKTHSDFSSSGHYAGSKVPARIHWAEASRLVDESRPTVGIDPGLWVLWVHREAPGLLSALDS